MKFCQYINEAVNKTEMQQVENDNDFNIGFEFEFIYKGDDTDYKQTYKLKQIIGQTIAPNGGIWFIHRDDLVKINASSTLDQDDEDFFIQQGKLEKQLMEFPREIATPYYSPQNAKKVLITILDYIKQNGYTNQTCGLHAGISHKKYKFFSDPLYMARASEEEHVFKNMPERRHFDSPNQEIEKDAHGGYWYNIDAKWQNLRRHEKKYIKDQEYWELRILGGTNYEKQFDFIWYKILKTCVDAMKSIGQIPKQKKQENKFKYFMKDIPK